MHQTRPCDGACCKTDALRPVDGDCFFRDPTLPERSCLLMLHPERLSELTKRERAYFDGACAGWPQNSPEQREFGVCCWSADAVQD